jgi:hypothetical protein
MILAEEVVGPKFGVLTQEQIEIGKKGGKREEHRYNS